MRAPSVISQNLSPANSLARRCQYLSELGPLATTAEHVLLSDMPAKTTGPLCLYIAVPHTDPLVMLDMIIDVLPYQFPLVGYKSELVMELFWMFKWLDDVTAIAAP